MHMVRHVWPGGRTATNGSWALVGRTTPVALATKAEAVIDGVVMAGAARTEKGNHNKMAT